MNLPRPRSAPLSDELRRALAGNHASSRSSLLQFRQSWGARDAVGAHQLFLGLRRTILSHLVWEEFALLEPFRERLPELAQVRAVSDELVTHRALRDLLAELAGLLDGRGAVDFARDGRIAIQLEHLQQQVDVHGSRGQNELCLALAVVLPDPARNELARDLRARDLRGAR